MIDLCAFNHPALTGQISALSLAALAIDLETLGKVNRQDGFDTSISVDTIETLASVRTIEPAHLIARINGVNRSTGQEVEQVIEAGADEILVPMVRHPDEVEQILRVVDGRLTVGVMIETSDAVTHRTALAALPLTRAYVGLNDLWIERRTPTRFHALIDGTVDSLCEAFESTPFGVAGLTHPAAGFPLPCSLLIGELARIDVDFTFLRRSFFAAIENEAPAVVIAAIKDSIRTAESRGETDLHADRRAFVSAVEALPAEIAPVDR
jgi:hypothetical protein